MPEEKQSVFQTLRAINLEEKHKDKDIGKGRILSYLSWASAWAAVKTQYPDATYQIVKDINNCIYHTDGKTCWVETSVTIEGLTQNEVLAIMNNTNQSISYEQVTSVNVQKSLKRCLTKNLALFGLDLNLWDGEELSDEAKEIKEAEEKEKLELLKVKREEVVAAGSKLMELGVTKDDVFAVVGKHNDGNKNPRSIQSIEVGDEILEDFKKMIPKTTKATKTAAKPAAKEKSVE